MEILFNFRDVTDESYYIRTPQTFDMTVDQN
jgi:hypothetical protein